jgi:hypothetical protein
MHYFIRKGEIMYIEFEDMGLTIKSEKIDRCVNSIYESIKKELPEEAQCIGVCEYVLKASIERLRHLRIGL